MQQLFIPTFRVDECMSEIKDSLEKGWPGSGDKTVVFEKDWCAYTGFKYAHFLNSATAALHIGFHILKSKYKWEDDDEVLTTPITFVSSNHAILYNKLKPVFVDVDEYICLDPIDLEQKITPKTKAIMFVAFGGSTGQFEKIKELAVKYNLKIILDNAHASGTLLNDKIFGIDEEIVCYSFQAVKNLPMADGGMLCTNDPEIDAVARRLSWMGISKTTFDRMNKNKGVYSWEYTVDSLGFKYGGNALMAAIGIVQLKYLDSDNSYRKQIANWYTSLLKEEIEDKGIGKIIQIPKNCDSSRHLYCLIANDRIKLINKLQSAEIFPGVHYRNNMEYSVYKNYVTECPNASRISDSIISLPLHLRLTRKDVKQICTVILNIEV